MNSIPRHLLLLLPLALVAPTTHGDEPLPLVLPGGDARSTDQGLAARSPLVRARLEANPRTAVRYSQLPEARDWAAEDLIQIVVVEQSTEKIDQRRQLDKEGLAQAEIAEFSSFDFGNFVFSPTTSSQLPGIEIGAEKEFQGQGRYQRKDEMSDRFTAKVVEVKPNGNLVVEARVVRNWSGDQTEITLTGVVNPKWITANDSVLSSQISDLKIDKKHTGPVEGTTQRGLIAEVLDFLFAF